MNDLESGWPQYRAVLAINEAMGRELEAERDEVELKRACIKGMREQMDKMEAELAALRADAARLDWLYTQVSETVLYQICYPHYTIGGGLEGLRAAIDAMQAAP